MKVLAISPHTDDAELGAGGTIAKLVEARAKVTCVAFTAPSAELKKEFRASGLILGMETVGHDMERRTLPDCRQAILDELIYWREKLEPDLVLGPSPHDLHQDHQTVAMEMLRAFKTTSMLAYELPWNHITFKATAFSAVAEEDLAKKLEALACYKSQQVRRYFDPAVQRAWALGHGVEAGFTYAERFEVLRWQL